jgi:hypothetical protein
MAKKHTNIVLWCMWERNNKGKRKERSPIINQPKINYLKFILDI